jgi:hypothetical protein
MKRTKLLVTLNLQFELEADAEEKSKKNAVKQLIAELEKVPLLAVGATIEVASVVSVNDLN